MNIYIVIVTFVCSYVSNAIYLITGSMISMILGMGIFLTGIALLGIRKKEHHQELISSGHKDVNRIIKEDDGRFKQIIMFVSIPCIVMWLIRIVIEIVEGTKMIL